MPECSDQCKIENTASHILKTISGDNTDLLNGYMGSFLGVKWAEHEADQRPKDLKN